MTAGSPSSTKCSRCADRRAVDEGEVDARSVAGLFLRELLLPVLRLVLLAERRRGDAARELELVGAGDAPHLDAVDGRRLFCEHHRREMGLLPGEIARDEPMRDEPIDEVAGRRGATDAPHGLAMAVPLDLLADLVDRLGHLVRVEAQP